ncbi:Hypothetical predicted protein, partial [Marmota monax]
PVVGAGGRSLPRTCRGQRPRPGPCVDSSASLPSPFFVSPGWRADQWAAKKGGRHS